MLNNFFRSSKNATKSFFLSTMASNSISLRLRFFLSAPAYHPTIQKILSGQGLAQLDPLLAQISNLSSHDREVALKLLLKNVYSHKLPYQTLLNHRFVTEAQKHPELYIDSTLFKIKVLITQLDEILEKGQLGQQKEKLSVLFRDIDASFKTCFEQYKKIPKEQALRPGIMINKRYADYYLLYLVGVTEKAEEKAAVLKKITQVYRGIIVEMAKLINQEGNRVKMAEDSALLEKETQQERQFKLNSMKESIRTIVESNSENFLHMFKSIHQLFKVTRDEKAYVEGVLQVISYIDRGLAYYQILKDMSLYSIFYLHLRKIKAELTHYYKSYKLRESDIPNKKAEQSKISAENNKQLGEIYKEAGSNLERVSGEDKYASNVNETALLMLGLRSQLIEKQKLEPEELKNKLLEEVQAILEKIISASNKKVGMEKLMSGVKMIIRNEEHARKKGQSTETNQR